ncbi:MAG: hypothetical protein IPK68_22430 [Bdellovibrionales bacterium]|nr:hypothetical protein [Bdellovibrionales bacterium]
MANSGWWRDLWHLNRDALTVRNGQEASRKAQGPSTHRLVRIRKRTGELAGYSEPFSIKGSASLTWAREAKLVVVTSENRIQLVSEEDGKLTNAQTLADPVIGPAIFADGKVFFFYGFRQNSRLGDQQKKWKNGLGG